MTDKAPFDLDAALAALASDERAASPQPSERLVARVRADAADVAAGRVAERRTAPAELPDRAPIPLRRSWLAMFSDAWATGAAAAAVLVLAIGFGVGYGAGPEMLAATGLGGEEALLADAGDDIFVLEDIL